MAGESPVQRHLAAAGARTLRHSAASRPGLDPLLPPGTSVRDDYVFFLLLAAERLAARAGARGLGHLATLLDSFLHAPPQLAALDVLALRTWSTSARAPSRHAVRTCITVWRSHRGPVQAATFRDAARQDCPRRPNASVPSVRSGACPVPADAARLDAEWSDARRAAGCPASRSAARA